MGPLNGQDTVDCGELSWIDLEERDVNEVMR